MEIIGQKSNGTISFINMDSCLVIEDIILKQAEITLRDAIIICIEKRGNKEKDELILLGLIILIGKE